MESKAVNILDRPSDDSASIAMALTIGVTSLTWLSVPIAFRYVEGVRIVIDSFALETDGVIGIFLGGGSIGVAATLGVLGTVPAVAYFATRRVKPKYLVAGICGTLALVLWVSMVSSFLWTLQSIGR